MQHFEAGSRRCLGSISNAPILASSRLWAATEHRIWQRNYQHWRWTLWKRRQFQWLRFWWYVPRLTIYGERSTALERTRLLYLHSEGPSKSFALALYLGLIVSAYPVLDTFALRPLTMASESPPAASAEHKQAKPDSPEPSLTNVFYTTGFGTNQGSSPFGAKPAFGAATTSGGGLFGGNTSTAGASTGFGGFGGTNNTTNPTSAFGSNTSNTGGGLFGNAATKPAFGAGTTSGGGLFGGGNNAFGATNNQTTSVFGTPQSTALGGNNLECQGTGSTPFQAYTEKEGSGSTQTNHFQSISFMAPYAKFSFEVSDFNLLPALL